MTSSGTPSAGNGVECPLCGDRRLRAVHRKETWIVFRCGACTNGFLASSSPAEALAQPGDWFLRIPEKRSLFRLRWRALGKAWKTLIYGGDFEARKLRRVLRWKRGGRLLDIGCAKGQFLSVARSHFEVQGVEVSPTALQRAQAIFGAQVFAGDVREAGFPGEVFDVITLFSTIEHLSDPLAVLGECRRLLREGGVLVVKTPNFSSLNRRILRGGWSGYKLPEHRFFFNPRGLQLLFAQAGLEPLPSTWFDRFPLSDNMYACAARKARDGEGRP